MSEVDPKQTQPLGSQSGSFPDPQRTQHYVPPPTFSANEPFDPRKTQVMGPTPGFDPTKTQVYQGPGAIPQLRPAPQNRKLVGWLISYTLHPNGVDFRLYEGRNLLGSDPKCDILLNDPKVSGHHLTILYRAGQFIFRDELSTNGTFINGIMVNEGSLQDGDVIRVGDTELKLRIA